MSSGEIRSRLRAQPFKPFTVVTADGFEVRVPHHDYAWLLSLGGEFYVEDADHKVHHIYTAHITRLVQDQMSEAPSEGTSDRPSRPGD